MPKSFRQPTDLSVGGHATAPPHEFIRGYAYEFIRDQKPDNQNLKTIFKKPHIF